jgi:hypothetical protein
VHGAPATVMPCDIEAIATERPHNLDLVLRYRPKGIIRAVWLLGWGRAVAVAAQTRGATACHDTWVNGLPCRSNNGGPSPNSRAAGLDIGERKAGHDFHELSPIGSMSRRARLTERSGLNPTSTRAKLSRQSGRESGRLPPVASV